MENLYENFTLQMNIYMDDNVFPVRTVMFTIPKECLHEYLDKTEDCRTEEEFFETYDSEESEAVYRYAEDDCRILKESIEYDNAFESAYSEYTAGSGTEISKEEYFWGLYMNN